MCGFSCGLSDLQAGLCQSDSPPTQCHLSPPHPFFLPFYASSYLYTLLLPFISLSSCSCSSFSLHIFVLLLCFLLHFLSRISQNLSFLKSSAPSLLTQFNLLLLLVLFLYPLPSYSLPLIIFLLSLTSCCSISFHSSSSLTSHNCSPLSPAALPPPPSLSPT